jgi:hypothetical protein
MGMARRGGGELSAERMAKVTHEERINLKEHRLGVEDLWQRG